MAMQTKITGQGGGLHRHREARDDVRAVAGGRGLRDVLHRLVVGAGVVLGDPHQPAVSSRPTAQAPNSAMA